MSLKWKFILALVLTAVSGSFPLGLIITDRQKEAELEQQISQGKASSAMLARSIQSILLFNGGELLPSRLDGREIIGTFRSLRDSGLVLAEVVLVSREPDRNGQVIARLDKEGNAVENLSQVSSEQVNSFLSHALDKREKKIKCPTTSGQCYQFSSVCKLPNSPPFCVARMLVSEDVILAPIHELEQIVGYVTGGVALLSIIGGFFMAFFITRHLGTLMRGVEKVGGGDLSYQVHIRASDEVGKLAGAFNSMASNLNDKIEEIYKTNRAYQRFVPEEFLKFLNKNSILEIERGESIQTDMTVLFSDIRSFTAISEGMTPGENFAFINSYLAEMGPVIREKNGFIDKYIGDAVMALFPHEADEAVRAGIDMQIRLKDFNAGRDIPVRIGVGVHTGSLMLGIIGEAERMEGTVISDAVNLASRLEGLTKKMGAGMLISEDTLAAMKDPTGFSLRYLGRINVKGKQNGAGLYEVLDVLPDEARRYKESDREKFAEGLKQLEASQFERARLLFKEIARRFPEDRAARIYYTLAKKEQTDLSFKSK